MDVLKGLKLKKSESSEDVDGADLFKEGNVVGLYFSAHWCPPCRAFTPQLATWYKKFKAGDKGDNLEIVFVSSDRNAESFEEYYAEMPWLALPYKNRDKKDKLSKKFKVTGIPTLVLLDGATGALQTTDGRSVVMEDPDGKDFPWKQKEFKDLIPGKLVDKEGTETDWGSVTEDYIGLYFSAHWCGPCRAFTPQLVKTYTTIREAGKSFQIIFVSSDRDEEALKEYLSSMPWLAIPYGDSRKKLLSRLYDVSGIPTLVILKKDGEVITQQGRAAISDDPEGKEFPWFPKPVNSLKGSTAGCINDDACVVWFIKEGEKEKAVEILTPLSLQHKKDVAEGTAESSLLFFYHDSDDDEEDIGSSLRNFCGIGLETKVVLLDIPNQSVYELPNDQEVNAENLGKMVADYNSGKLDKRPLKS